MPTTFDQAVGFDGSEYFDGAAPSYGISSLMVEFAFGSYPMGAPAWSDVTADVHSVTTNRGRNSPLENFDTGTATVVLDNGAAKYDPLNTASPFYGQILPMVQMRISALDSTFTRRYLFSGYVQPRQGWTFEYPGSPLRAVATANCVDFMAILAARELATIAPTTVESAFYALGGSSGLVPPSGTLRNIKNLFLRLQGKEIIGLYPGVRTGTQLSSLVSDGYFPTGGLAATWTVATGQTLVQPYQGGQNALQFVQLLAQSEGGAFYIDRDGKPTFDGRYTPLSSSRSNASQATFDDSGSNVPYRDGSLQIDYGSVIYNHAEIAPVGQDAQTADDTASQTTYTRSDYNQTGQLMDSSAEAIARAKRVVSEFKDAVPTPQQLTLTPVRSTTILDAALTRELRDRVTVKFRPPSAAARVTTQVFVERISHSVDASSRQWTTELSFSSAAAYADTSTFFRWDGTTAWDGTKSWAF